jgi:hypothetical protein
MNRRFAQSLTCCAVVVVAGSVALAQSSRDKKTAPGRDVAPAMELPAGMTEADMQACMEAAAPGPMHAFLAESVGTWAGKTSMWMSADSEPVKSLCTSTITSVMDGRFTRCETTGEMPGMGPFNGFGLYGFDNVSEKFQAVWVDNFGTGMMVGSGERSSDGKTLTWTYKYNCPMTKSVKTMREVSRRTGPNSMTMAMYGPDPGTGKEYKSVEIEFKRQPSLTAVEGQN